MALPPVGFERTEIWVETCLQLLGASVIEYLKMKGIHKDHSTQHGSYQRYPLLETQGKLAIPKFSMKEAGGTQKHCSKQDRDSPESREALKCGRIILH